MDILHTMPCWECESILLKELGPDHGGAADKNSDVSSTSTTIPPFEFIHMQRIKEISR